MNRAFKTQFHNGGDKTIVTVSLAVNNGKLFNNLDKECKQHLIDALQIFNKQVAAFTEEVMNSIDKPYSGSKNEN